MFGTRRRWWGVLIGTVAVSACVGSEPTQDAAGDDDGITTVRSANESAAPDAGADVDAAR